MCDNVNKYNCKERIADHETLVVVVLAYLSRETSDIFGFGWDNFFLF